MYSSPLFTVYTVVCLFTSCLSTYSKMFAAKQRMKIYQVLVIQFPAIAQPLLVVIRTFRICSVIVDDSSTIRTSSALRQTICTT